MARRWNVSNFCEEDRNIHAVNLSNGSSRQVQYCGLTWYKRSSGVLSTNLCCPVYETEVPTAIIIFPALVSSILPYSFIKPPISFSSTANALIERILRTITRNNWSWSLKNRTQMNLSYRLCYFDNGVLSSARIRLFAEWSWIVLISHLIRNRKRLCIRLLSFPTCGKQSVS